MPLLDHFHEPLHSRRSWESFHSRWANCIADALQALLPPRYFAEVQIHLGSRVEADVAEFESTVRDEGTSPNGPGGGVALQTWAPPAPPIIFPAVFPDDIEVHVRDERDDARLVGVVELISPRNKDRNESRRTFAAKCAAYLGRGVGVVVVDIVSERHANLHNELLHLLGLGEPHTLPSEVFLYAVAYRPARRQEANQIEAWPSPLTFGEALPVLPLALRGYRAVPLDLETTYTAARARSRI